MNLGEQLKTQNDARAEAERRRIEAERQKVAREAQERRDRYARALEDVKTYVAGQIASNKPVAARKMPKVSFPKLGNGVQMSHPTHPLHDLWLEFATWAATNGLKAKAQYGYNDGATESWDEVLVEPAD